MALHRLVSHSTGSSPRFVRTALMIPKRWSKRNRQAKAETKAGTAQGTMSSTR
jgi:hypothetical protein